MNSYEFHIGDYYRETRNLSQTEHYIYRSLLDEFYLQEIPLTSEIRSLMRDIGLTSDQKEDLEYILNKFWELTDDGWVNNRANEELARVYAKSETAKANANARWEKYRRNAGAMQAHSNCNAGGMLPLDPLTPLPSDPIKNAGVKTSAKSSPCPYQQIVDLYHEKLPMLPRVVTLSDGRKRAMKARWSNGASNMKFWMDYFDSVSESKFLTGHVDPSPGRKQFVADIDFLIRESTIIKTQEGKYHG